MLLGQCRNVLVYLFFPPFHALHSITFPQQILWLYSLCGWCLAMICNNNSLWCCKARGMHGTWGGWIEKLVPPPLPSRPSLPSLSPPPSQRCKSWSFKAAAPGFHLIQIPAIYCLQITDSDLFFCIFRKLYYVMEHYEISLSSRAQLLKIFAKKYFGLSHLKKKFRMR